MSGDLEEVEASYLQHPSFEGQQVVIPAVGDSPAIAGRLSGAVVYRPGIAARTVACPTGAVHPEVFLVRTAHVELFLSGRVITLAPGARVLVEPLPAAPLS